jgi:hypothetical protein
MPGEEKHSINVGERTSSQLTSNLRLKNRNLPQISSSGCTAVQKEKLSLPMI